jgi:hypothetical protein
MKLPFCSATLALLLFVYCGCDKDSSKKHEYTCKDVEKLVKSINSFNEAIGTGNKDEAQRLYEEYKGVADNWPTSGDGLKCSTSTGEKNYPFTQEYKDKLAHADAAMKARLDKL